MPPSTSSRESTDQVKVRNNTRRGLLVRVPGHALHLQPGQEAEVPRAYLETDELAALVRSGAVLPLAARAAAAPAGGGPPAAGGDEPVTPPPTAPPSTVAPGPTVPTPPATTTTTGRSPRNPR